MISSDDITRLACDISALSKSPKVAVLGHIRPDGDCIGSQVALCRMLRQLGSDAVCVNADPIPESFRHFVGETPFVRFEDFEDEGHVGVVVDANKLERLGDAVAARFRERIALVIDHHPQVNGFALSSVCRIHTGASSAAEILGLVALDPRLAHAAQKHHPEFIRSVADPIALGTFCDTGGFIYNINAQTFAVAAKMTLHGADYMAVRKRVFESHSLAKLRLSARLIESIRLAEDGKIATAFITEKDILETGAAPDDADAISWMVSGIKGVEMSATVRQKNGAVHVSLRGQPHHQLNALATSFGGGGHPAASGISFPDGDPALVAREMECALAHHRRALAAGTEGSSEGLRNSPTLR